MQTYGGDKDNPIIDLQCALKKSDRGKEKYWIACKRSGADPKKALATKRSFVWFVLDRYPFLTIAGAIVSILAFFSYTLSTILYEILLFIILYNSAPQNPKDIFNINRLLVVVGAVVTIVLFLLMKHLSSWDSILYLIQSYIFSGFVLVFSSILYYFYKAYPLTMTVSSTNRRRRKGILYLFDMIDNNNQWVWEFREHFGDQEKK